jgi:FMN reductase
VIRAIFIAGSPSPTSRSSFVASRIASSIEARGIATRSFSLRDFDAADVVYARMKVPAIGEFVEAVKSASAIVLSTPVYKATYSGALKALVDLIPPDALTGKPALGVATTKLAAHGLEVSRSYDALFAFFRARGLDTLVVLDDDLKADGASFAAAGSATWRIEEAAQAVAKALQEK